MMSNQQCQSIEGKLYRNCNTIKMHALIKLEPKTKKIMHYYFSIMPNAIFISDISNTVM